MMQSIVVKGIATVLTAASLTIGALAQAPSTAFTYQGSLRFNNTPVTGTYDLIFTLYDVATGGTPLDDPYVAEDVSVTDGLFTVEIDFGADLFNGQRRWLEIGVRDGNSTDPFTTLNPRIELTPVPYALLAQKAKDAENAQNTTAIQNRPVSTAAPAPGQVLKWNGSTWTPDNDLRDQFWQQHSWGIWTPSHIGVNTTPWDGSQITTRGESYYAMYLARPWISDPWIRIGLTTYHGSQWQSEWQIASRIYAPDDNNFSDGRFVVWNGAYGNWNFAMNPQGHAAINGDIYWGTALTVRPALNPYRMKSTAVVVARGGGLLEDWPGDWDGGIATFDIVLGSAQGWQFRIRSDENYKQNISSLNNSDSMRLLSLRPVRYEHRSELIEKYGAPAGTRYGFIAQELQQIFPELVLETRGIDGDENKKGLSVDYMSLIPHLVNVVQQQQREINELRALVQQLQSGVSAPK